MFKRTNSCFFIVGALGLAACDSSLEEPEMQTGDIPITDEFGREPVRQALTDEDEAVVVREPVTAEEGLSAAATIDDGATGPLPPKNDETYEPDNAPTPTP